MLKSLGQDSINVELIDEKQFILYHEENEVKFRLGKTKTNKYLVIQALYKKDLKNSSFEFFQSKLTLNNLQEKSKKFGSEFTMDDCFQIIINSFEENNVKVKDIAKTKYLKLSFNFEIKPLDINLLYKNIDISLITNNFNKEANEEQINNVDKEKQNLNKFNLDINNKIKEEKNKNEFNLNYENNKEDNNYKNENSKK